MASPQLEHGYTRIANELLEIIYGTNFNATQIKIILCIIRFTYGFHRKSHAISLSFISNATGISKRYVSNELQKLIEANVILVAKEYTAKNSRELQLNKKYSEWIGYRTILPQVKDTSTGEERNTTTDEQYFTTTDEQYFYQERKYKDNIKESRADSFSQDANTEKSSNKVDDKYEELFINLWKLYPNKKGKGSVSKKSKKGIYNIGKDNMVKAIDNYKKDLQDNPWRQPLYGSTFFNGRYKDYLPVEDNKDKVMPTGKIKMLTKEDIQRDIEKQEAQQMEQTKTSRAKIRYID